MKFILVGNCVESFDHDGYSIDLRETCGMVDSSDMACVDEDSVEMDREWFMEKLMIENPCKIESEAYFLWNEDREIAMIYNPDEDIHYFFAVVK